MIEPVGGGRLAQALHYGGGRKHAEAERRLDNGAAIEIAVRFVHTATERLENVRTLKGGRHVGQRVRRLEKLAHSITTPVPAQRGVDLFERDDFGDLGIAVASKRKKRV